MNKTIHAFVFEYQEISGKCWFMAHVYQVVYDQTKSQMSQQG